MCILHGAYFSSEDNIYQVCLHWDEIYNCQMLHVAIVDSIMKEEDAQRMGKTVDRVVKKNHFESMCRTIS
jgi:hypothetical protein